MGRVEANFRSRNIRLSCSVLDASDHIKAYARFKNPEDADRMDNMQVLCTDCHRAKTKTDLKVLSRMR